MGDEWLRESLEKLHEALQEIADLLRKTKAKASTDIKPAGSTVWDHYSQAYEARYKAAPVRNKKTNALCKQLVDRLGAEEAPQVAVFYLKHTGPLYVSSAHCLDLLVRDAEKLRTEWATGTVVLPKTRAQSVSDANRDLWERIERGEA